MGDNVVWIWFISSIIFGIVCASIAPGKNRSQVSFFFLGFLLGIIGLLLCATARPDVPTGMREFKCPRCNTKQNVPVAEPNAECWQCHYVVKAKSK